MYVSVELVIIVAIAITNEWRQHLEEQKIMKSPCH